MSVDKPQSLKTLLQEITRLREENQQLKEKIQDARKAGSLSESRTPTDTSLEDIDQIDTAADPHDDDLEPETFSTQENAEGATRVVRVRQERGTGAFLPLEETLEPPEDDPEGIEET